MFRAASRTLSLTLLALVPAACSGDKSAARPGGAGGSLSDGDSGPGGEPPAPRWPTLDCDPLVPTYCAYPFPSNVYSVEDPETPTGRRVRLAPAMLPVSSTGGVTLPDPWSQSDGFSPGAAILAHFPGATGAGLTPPIDPAASLAADSKTVLLNADTGERVLHFAELDRSGDDDAERTLLIRPLVRLADASRYIVAIRGLEGPGGPLAATSAFAALRDAEASDDPSVEGRRDLYENIFHHLDAVGVPRENLQLAWDFTTASRENNTARMIHMRDQALAALPESGPTFVVTEVEEDPTPELAYRLELTVSTPLFLDTPDPGGRLLLDAGGLPERNAETPSVDVPVRVAIPRRALDTPVTPLQYGHGLLGNRRQIDSGHFRTFSDEYGYALFGVDLWGMAEDDVPFIAGALAEGELHRLASMFDRLHQGMLNSLVAMRLATTSLAADPTYGPLLDPEERYYYGISQGGIFGGVYMAVTTDVPRGVLGVMGQPYNLLLNRSVDFDPFFTVLRGSWPSALDQQLGLVLVQMLWDRLEPNGYTPYIRENLLPGTPPHEVLMRAARGDHQVHNVAAHVMARSVGATHVDTGLGDIFGLSKAARVENGSGYVEYDFGLPPDPICNVPPRACVDPHGKIRGREDAREQMNQFLRTGVIENFCEGGVCSFPELSECGPGETNDEACD
jgi:hypothetical protein